LPKLLNSRKLNQNGFLTHPTQLTLDTQQQSVSRTHNINSSSAAGNAPDYSQAHSQQRTTYTIRHAATAASEYKEINQ